MRFWVGVTDNKWYEYLASTRPDEVNFWQPSATPPFRDAPIGLPFLFKLKRPYNHVAGGGFYVTYSSLPIEIAWEVFGVKNGCTSLRELRGMIDPLTSNKREGEVIGCTVLANPFFFEQPSWLADPPGWAPSIVRGKMYDSAEGAGLEIWRRVEPLITLPASGLGGANTTADDLSLSGPAEAVLKYGPAVAIRPRLGQGSFRVLVTEAYQRRCAITGESTLVALEAAHIVPFSGSGGHDVQNGLLLRADFHRLFDVGMVSVTPNLEVRISPAIREAWSNGKVYYRLDRAPLSVVPKNPAMRPNPEFLDWHFRNVFRASA